MSEDLERNPDIDQPTPTDDNGAGWYDSTLSDGGANQDTRPNNTKPDLAELESGGDQNPSTPGFDYGGDDENSPQTSKLKGRFKGLSSGKKWGIAFLGGFPLTIAMVAVGALALLLISGFQVGHVARVLKDFNYIFAVRNSRSFARRGLLAGLDPTSRYKITNKESLSRLGLVDEVNPERSVLQFDGKTSLLSRRPQQLSIGDTVIDIPQGFGRNSSFRGAERRSFIDAVDNAILEHPDLGKMSSYARNRVAKATLDSVGVKLNRWDKTKRFFQDVKDWKTTVKEFYEDTGKKLDRAKAKVGLSTNDGKKASELAEEALDDPDIISDAAGSPSQSGVTRGVIEALEESETAIAKTAKLASKVSVVEIVGWLCLFRDLKKVIVDGSLQRMYALSRLAAQSFSAYDQFTSGDTSAAAIGMTAKSYANFATNVSYQQAVFGSINGSSAHAFNSGYDARSLVNKGYEPVPEDVNIWTPLSAGKRIVVALGSIGITKLMVTATPLSFASALNVIGIDVDAGFDKVDDGICNALTTPAGIIGAAVTEIIIQIVLGVLSGGTETVASEGAEQAAKQSLIAAAKEVGASLIGKITFNTFRKEVAEYGAVTALRGTIWTFTRESGKFAVLTAGSVEAAALLEKLASAGSGLDLGGVGPDFNYFNKASLGANFLGNSYSQKVNYGRPSTADELAEVRQTQYEEVLLANKNQNILTRLSLSNPRSPSSLFLATIHPDRSYFSKGIEYALSLPSLVFNPTKSNSIYSLAMDAFEKPSSSTFAQNSESGDGYHVWFYSKAEEEKLTDDPSFDPDLNADYVEPKLAELEDRYGKCYQDDEAKMFNDDVQRSISSSTNLADLFISESDQGFNYCAKVLQEDDALHYRVYKADQLQKQYLDDVANATDDYSDTSPAPDSPDEPVVGDTSSTPCATGSTDAGVVTGYSNGRPYSIRICSVAGVTSGGSDADSGGLARFNSTMSVNVVNLINAAKSEGIEPSFTSSFRTMEYQQDIRARFNCPNETTSECPGGTVARAGYSNHQMGFAFDISTTSAFWNWMRNNGERFGYKWYGPGDTPHFSITGR